MVTHYFKEDLAWSDGMNQWTYYLKVLNKYFPEALEWSRTTDLVNQKLGNDIELELPSGIIKIQVKARRKYYSDILIEYAHDFGYEMRPGWIETNAGIDWLLYTCPSEGKSCCIDFKSLQKAWRENKETWIRKYGMKPVKNTAYHTLNVTIDPKILKGAGVIFRSRT